MKFSQSLFVIAIAAVSFVSCKKDTVTPPVVTPPTSPIDVVLKFNGNLTDSTGKITSTTPTGSITYVNDHNGNANSALYLNGSSKVVFGGVNIKGTSMTMSAWVKYTNPSGGLQFIATVLNGSSGPALIQSADKLGCAVSVPSTNSAIGISVDANWHHIATTYDGTNIKVYEDGVLTSTVNHPGTMSDGVRNMELGFFSTDFWKGSIDELRIYSTVLSASDIQKLMAL